MAVAVVAGDTWGGRLGRPPSLFSQRVVVAATPAGL